MKWLVNLFGVDLFGVVLLQTLTRQVVSVHPPNCHVLVAARHKALVLERVELKAENWVKSKVPKRKRSVLLPLKHLDTESAVHPDRAQDFAIGTKCHMQNTALMCSFQDD